MNQQNLKDKRILLGVSGGIALYKACELLRRLQDAGAQVRVAMTPGAETFVTAQTFAALSGHPVYIASANHTNSAFQHIDFPRWADIMVVAPATANTIAKLASGLADEPVSLCYMASTAAKVIVPAMNSAMFMSPAVQRNLEQLRADGCTIVAPDSGLMACGEVGPGRFPEVATIISSLSQHFSSSSVAGSPSPARAQRVLITAGRTEEDIDPVRTITNKSSGITGVTLAQTFVAAGYPVTLVHGPMEAPIPAGVEAVSVRSAQQMHQAVMERQSAHHILIFCAAVADYRPKVKSPEKIKDSSNNQYLELVPNPNILRSAVAHKTAAQYIVGFALETADPLTHGLAKLQKSGADLLVLNTPVKTTSGFGKDSVEFTLLQPQHTAATAPSLALGTKLSLAQQVLTQVQEHYV